MVENMMVQMSVGTSEPGSASGPVAGPVSGGTGQDGLPLANFADLLQAVAPGFDKLAENLPGSNLNLADGKAASLAGIMQKLLGFGGADKVSGVGKRTDSKDNVPDASQQVIAQLQASGPQPAFFIIQDQTVNSSAAHSGGISLDALNAATLSPAISSQDSANTAQNLSSPLSGPKSAATSQSDILIQSIAGLTAQNTFSPIQSAVNTTAQNTLSTVQSAVNTAAQNTLSPVQSAVNTAAQNTFNPLQSAVNTTAQNTLSTVQSAVNTAVQNTFDPVQSAVNTTTQNTFNPVPSAVNTAAQNTLSQVQSAVNATAQNTLSQVQSAAYTTAQNTLSQVQSATNTTAQNSGNTRLDAFAENMSNDLNIEEVRISAANETKSDTGDTSDSTASAAVAMHQTAYSKETEPAQENVPVNQLNQLSAPIMDTLESGGRHLVIKLSPPDMGTIEIKLKVENGILTADFRMDSNAVKDLFTVAMPHIKQSIEEAGIKTGNFFADLKEDSNADGGKQQDTNQQQQKQQKGQNSSFFDFFA